MLSKLDKANAKPLSDTMLVTSIVMAKNAKSSWGSLRRLCYLNFRPNRTALCVSPVTGNVAGRA